MTIERLNALAVLEPPADQPSRLAVELRVGQTLVLVPPGSEAIVIELKHKSGPCARVEVRAARSVRIDRP